MSTSPDPWLQQALRHAPDADVAPPPALREAILREARRAVQPAPAPVRPAWWQRLADAWLRPAPLGYSGALMALLVLGVWGVDRLGDEAGKPVERDLPAAVVAQAPPAAPSDVAAAPAAVVAAMPAVRPPEAVRANKARPARRDEAVATAPALPALPAPPAAPVAADAAPAPAAERAAAAPAEAAAKAAARGAAAPAPASAMAGALTAAAPHPATTAAPQRQVQERAQGGAAAPAVDPLGALARRIATDPGARWQSAAFDGAHGARQEAWLDYLRVAASGRWLREASTPGTASDLRVLSGGDQLAAFWIRQPAEVRVMISGTTWLAVVPEATAADLERLRAQW